eukprot:TRINITY_DN273_c1_g3_i1.p1 TRINITY_DN273_c1_g3~~TRINITY_DN273_c1_g3_i1.p1  ORF type:complete len:445 (-),score=127.75 TRINITY_DN273_c1_g3_i1:219-1553(-)
MISFGKIRAHGEKKTYFVLCEKLDKKHEYRLSVVGEEQQWQSDLYLPQHIPTHLKATNISEDKFCSEFVENISKQQDEKSRQYVFFINDGGSLSFTIHKMTKRGGRYELITITLEEIDTKEQIWTTLHDSLRDFQIQNSRLTAENLSLNASLEAEQQVCQEALDSRCQVETELIENFCKVLNTKKAKIREVVNENGQMKEHIENLNQELQMLKDELDRRPTVSNTRTHSNEDIESDTDTADEDIEVFNSRTNSGRDLGNFFEDDENDDDDDDGDDGEEIGTQDFDVNEMDREGESGATLLNRQDTLMKHLADPSLSLNPDSMAVSRKRSRASFVPSFPTVSRPSGGSSLTTNLSMFNNNNNKRMNPDEKKSNLARAFDSDSDSSEDDIPKRRPRNVKRGPKKSDSFGSQDTDLENLSLLGSPSVKRGKSGTSRKINSFDPFDDL